MVKSMKKVSMKKVLLTALVALAGGVLESNAAVSITYVADAYGNIKLVDGAKGAKWEGGRSNDMWCIFKTSLPIQPTSYVLTTGNDNKERTGRNWKDWTVFGGNFASDDEAKNAVRSTEGGWVALDVRTNDNILEDQNTTDYEFTMNNSDTEHYYTYYLVKVTDTKGDGWMQMGEFAFKDYTVDTSAYDDAVASAQAFFDTSAADDALQEEYAALVSSLDGLKAAGFDSGDFTALEEALENVYKLQGYIKAYATQSYAVLSTDVSAWGSNEDAAKLLDGNKDTKWGGDFKSGNIVWRLKEGMKPLFYQLTAAGDTNTNPGRNWKSWSIYAGNFTNALDATIDADGWVEIFSTENGGMTTQNGESQSYHFSSAPDKNYQYFKVYLKSNTDGDQSQMADLTLIDDPDEFADFQTQFEADRIAATAEFEDIDYSEVGAEAKAAYETAVNAIGTANTYQDLYANINAAREALDVMADDLDERLGVESVNISGGLDADVFTRNIPAVGDKDIIEGFDNNTTGFYSKTVTTSNGSETTAYGVPDDGILTTSNGHKYAFDYDNLNAVSIKKGETKTMTIAGERQSKSWRFYFLGTASNGPADMTATFNYDDGTTSTAEFQIYNWDTNNEMTRAVTVYQTGRVFNGKLADGNNNFRFYELPALVKQNKVITSISLYNSGQSRSNSKAMVFGFCIVGKDNTSEMFYMGSNGYATYVPEVKPVDLSSFAEDELAAYTVSIAEGRANLTQVTTIPVGSAVVMKGKAGFSYKLPYTTGAAALTGNELIAATREGVTADGTQYVLANGTEGVGFYKAKSTTVIPAGKGYLEITASGRKSFYGFEIEDATGINEINGQASMLNDQPIYNIAGQRIGQMQRGINIVGGKKILK